MKRVALFWLIPALAFANGWRPQPERRNHLAGVAQRHGLTRASQFTVDRFNQRFGSSLGADHLYYTSWDQFMRFAAEAQQVALGVSYVDHGGGPHAMIVVGNRVRDSIDPGLPGTFHENGQKTRDQSLLEGHSSARVLALWNAPVDVLTTVGINTDAAVRNHAWHGLNCVAMVNGNLWSEAHVPHDNPQSPFYLLRPQGFPVEGAESVLGLNPDLVIQVVDQGSFGAISSNHHGHLIKPWYSAY